MRQIISYILFPLQFTQLSSPTSHAIACSDEWSGSKVPSFHVSEQHTLKDDHLLGMSMDDSFCSCLPCICLLMWSGRKLLSFHVSEQHKLKDDHSRLLCGLWLSVAHREWLTKENRNSNCSTKFLSVCF